MMGEVIDDGAGARSATMRRFRFRLSWCLWVVALVAAFLAGMRYGGDRARPKIRTIVVAGADERVYEFDVNTPTGSAAFDRTLAKARQSGLAFQVR
jgi:hypothetical protein